MDPRLHHFPILNRRFDRQFRADVFQPQIQTRLLGLHLLSGKTGSSGNSQHKPNHITTGRTYASYKSVPVSAAVESPYYFRIVADYIHLNPARAGIVGRGRGKLISYKWSSIGDFARGKGPEWLVMERVLKAFELSQDARGRRAYAGWLEARAENEGGGKVVGRDGVARAHDEAEAENLASQALRLLDLSTGVASLSGLRKGDWRKGLVAVLLRKRISVGNRWLADRRAMGHPAGMGKLMGSFRNDEIQMEKLGEIENRLQSNT